MSQSCGVEREGDFARGPAFGETSDRAEMPGFRWGPLLDRWGVGENQRRSEISTSPFSFAAASRTFRFSFANTDQHRWHMPSRLITDYAGLLQALRDRRDELDISHEVIGDIAGLQNGYASKVLCDPPMKGLGPQTLGPVLGALGLAVVLVEDPAAVARVQGRWTKRLRPPTRGLRCVANQCPPEPDGGEQSPTEKTDAGDKDAWFPSSA
jgi:hypothetical protein